VVRGNLGGDITIGIPERNNFYNAVRQIVEQDRGWDGFARDIITPSGDTDTAPATAPFSRQVQEYYASAQITKRGSVTRDELRRVPRSVLKLLRFNTSGSSQMNGVAVSE
jgi:hypothetical protein